MKQNLTMANSLIWSTVKSKNSEKKQQKQSLV